MRTSLKNLFAGRTGSPALWKRATLLLLLSATALCLYPLPARLLLGEWVFPFDDPYIHQVYARNIALHGEYAFNLGETSTGSSAPLWTFLMVPAHWLGLPAVVWAVAWGLLALAGLGAVMWAWARQRFPEPLPTFLTAAALLTPHIAWAGVEGMETALVAALALLCLWRLDRGRWTGTPEALAEGALHGLLLWLRPEAPLLTLIAAWQRRREGRRLLACGASYLALAGLYIGFHLLMGSRPLPQTVYAKVAYYGRPPTPAGILSFLGDLLLNFMPGIWPLVGVLVLVSIWRMARRRAWPWGPGLVWAGLTLLLAALRLPAVLHFGRHFVPLLPVLLLASGEALSSFPPLGRRMVLALAGILLMVGIWVGVTFYQPLCRDIQESHIAMGRWVAAHLPKGAVLATHDIGAIGYYGGHPVVDTLALITPEITPLVAARDQAGLWHYLQERGVHYLATFRDQYEEIRARPGVERLTATGRMELLLLPDRNSPLLVFPPTGSDMGNRLR